MRADEGFPEPSGHLRRRMTATRTVPATRVADQPNSGTPTVVVVVVVVLQVVVVDSGFCTIGLDDVLTEVLAKCASA